ncbi:MLP-like protein 43 [Sesbania bispinosa]|nr:MLP-like protein 43 [Sesbania bispinosa]
MTLTGKMSTELGIQSPAAKFFKFLRNNFTMFRTFLKQCMRPRSIKAIGIVSVLSSTGLIL